MVYYNEHDPAMVQWLRQLIRQGSIADGVVDDRSIQDVCAADVKGFTQHHFFAGIGGWSYALRLAGWPDDQEVWTGSCPCQGHSTATHGRSIAPDLWPAFFSLVTSALPPVIFGEQVATVKDWFDGVCDDLETLDYKVGAAVLPALSVAKNHTRYRLYYCGYTNSDRKSKLSVDAKTQGLFEDRGHARNVARTNGLSARVAMRGYGNAIVPEVAQAFIESCQKALGHCK